jgi:hypothetical protein
LFCGRELHHRLHGMTAAEMVDQQKGRKEEENQ